MDLKIKDVADLLNVSETTIRRWVADRKIPAYRINQQYRFSRLEVEDWVMRNHLGKVPNTAIFGDVLEGDDSTETLPPRGNKQFSLYRAIHKGGVLTQVPGTTKEEVIRATMKVVAKEMNLDADVLSELLVDREKMHPTALNRGIAIPHARDFLLSTPYDVITVVFPEKSLPYNALDGQPVHTLFFLFACDDKRHLHLLAKIAHFCSHPSTQELLKSKPNKDKLLTHLKTWESSES